MEGKLERTNKEIGCHENRCGQTDSSEADRDPDGRDISLVEQIYEQENHHQIDIQYAGALNIDVSDAQIQEILKNQNSRPLSAFQITKLEKEAQRNWDIFYKRNETRFFKDRQWTLREFDELRIKCEQCEEQQRPVTLLEIGCGVGNFAFPLIEELSRDHNGTPVEQARLKIYACDFSPRAIGFLRSNKQYDETKVHGFVCDVTLSNCFSSEDLDCNLKTDLTAKQVDFVSLIFVLSAVCPSKHAQVIPNIYQVTKPGSIVFFRDYGRYDTAQLRFGPGKKIDENFYVRRDGTRSYYFTLEEVESLFTKDGHFEKLQCAYVNRRTINRKENIDVGRNFVQAKFIRK